MKKSKAIELLKAQTIKELKDKFNIKNEEV
jgi:hypothetical protein